jgi:hypothetical protein
MILLFKLIAITYILVMGLKIAMSEDMLLEKVGDYFEKKAKQNRVFDLFICPWCMGTLQSIVAHFFAFGLGILPFVWNWQLLIRWPLVVMGTSLLAGMTWTVYETINRIKEAREAEAAYYDSLIQLNQNQEDGEK